MVQDGTEFDETGALAGESGNALGQIVADNVVSTLKHSTIRARSDGCQGQAG
jgi:hypothetical protein